MPAQNYILLNRIELNASAASVTFSNIPQSGYTDLKIVASARSTSGGSVAYSMFMKMNNLTTSIYSQRALEGSGSAASSFTQSGVDTAVRVGLITGTGATSNTFSNTEIYIPNYTSSNAKSVSVDTVAETNATTQYSNLIAYLVNSTAAITSLTFSTEPAGGVAFAQYSTFSLYGLAAVGTTPVIAPKASGGNITSDGTYWIHTFNSTGTFTPLQGLTCDYLVVAGGGGGGQQYAGAGGAGGLRSTVGATGGGGSLESALSVSAQAYTITVGAGGVGSTNRTVNGTNGSNSVFSSITSTGGAGGVSGQVQTQGATGGSGGGGTGNGNILGGLGTANQGYAGGQGNDPALRGGGGGGAGAAGASGSASGNGGNGVATSISGTSVTYAGGGGGGSRGTVSSAGSGGTGGGGAGTSNTTTATSGTTNLGGGGGGGGDVSGGNGGAGGNGGSGIVIIRYPIA